MEEADQFDAAFAEFSKQPEAPPQAEAPAAPEPAAATAPPAPSAPAEPEPKPEPEPEPAQDAAYASSSPDTDAMASVLKKVLLHRSLSASTVRAYTYMRPAVSTASTTAKTYGCLRMPSIWVRCHFFDEPRTQATAM